MKQVHNLNEVVVKKPKKPKINGDVEKTKPKVAVNEAGK